MRIAPEISGVSIVILGNFNPAIFQPAWLVRSGIEQDLDDDLIKIELIHKEVAQFAIDKTAYIIDSERFQISTTSAPWIQIADKVSVLFGETLPHSPVRAFGLNYDIHFKVSSTEKRTSIGRTLAPIAPWGAFGRSMEGKTPETVGGLLSQTMRSIELSESYSINKNVKIEPSAKINDSTGIYMQANFHYQANQDITAPDLVGAIQDVFQNRVNEAEEIFDTVMGL